MVVHWFYIVVAILSVFCVGGHVIFVENYNMKTINFISILFCLYFTPGKAQYFTKITSGAIATSVGDSRSVNWVDVNNDGLLDCFVSNGPSGGQNNALFMNVGAGNFTKLVNDTIVKDNNPSDGASFADTDNDGDLDGFVANWYNVNNLMYTNNGTGNFTRLTTGQLVNDLGYSETATWGDYDKDGLVDLYVSNSAGVKRNFLYHNNGNNTFTKITTGTIALDGFFSRGINWTDIDNDNDLDMFVCNENNQNENIYRNDGSGTFVKLNTGPLLTNAAHTMSSSWADYDNDGDLDVFLANAQSYNALFRNDGAFAFSKIATDTVSLSPSNSFSAAWSDVDNDGDLDLFVTNSFYTTSLQQNFFYINNGDGSFTRNGSDIVATDSSWSYGCAFGDYDNDGFEDLVVATCRFNGIDYPHLQYHNNGNANNWITIKLQGVLSNHSAIGTKVYVKATISGNAVWQMREVSSQSSYCGQNDMRSHFGLGDASSIDSIKIVWPLGTTEYYTNLTTNQFVSYVEGASISLTKSFKQNKLNVYPNPSTNSITIELENQAYENDKITITTIDGRVVAETKVSGNKKIVVDLKKFYLSAGIYFVKLISENVIYSQKLIIE
jgi:enediyne biosynthesis protein E4